MAFPTFTSIFHDNSYPRISPSLPSLSCKGKTIIVTGGGSGIGKSIARNFLVAGANVFILGRSESRLRKAVAELSEQFKSQIAYQAADVTDSSAVRSALATAVEKFGKIDVLVSNAAHLDSQNPIATSDLNDYWLSYETNVKAGIVLLQEFHKLAKPNATVINVSSAAAQGVFGNISAYSSTKLAFVRICDYFQAENPEMRVFSIHPGRIATETAMKAKGPMEYPDDVDLPGAFSVWLASPEADFLKGRFVWANWDVDELVQKKDVIVAKNMLSFQLSGWLSGLQD